MPDKSFAEKLLRKAGQGERLNPEEDARTKERQANAFGLGVRFKDGRSSEGFSWADYRGCRWEDLGDKERVTVIFGARVVTVEGYNLDVLVRDIEHGQLSVIREHSGRQVMQLRNENPDNEPIIESIETAPCFEELVREIKGEEERETRFTRRLE
jgi:hypothetical protein